MCQAGRRLQADHDICRWRGFGWAQSWLPKRSRECRGDLGRQPHRPQLHSRCTNQSRAAAELCSKYTSYGSKCPHGSDTNAFGSAAAMKAPRDPSNGIRASLSAATIKSGRGATAAM